MNGMWSYAKYVIIRPGQKPVEGRTGYDCIPELAAWILRLNLHPGDMFKLEFGRFFKNTTWLNACISPAGLKAEKQSDQRLIVVVRK